MKCKGTITFLSDDPKLFTGSISNDGKVNHKLTYEASNIPLESFSIKSGSSHVHEPECLTDANIAPMLINSTYSHMMHKFWTVQELNVHQFKQFDDIEEFLEDVNYTIVHLREKKELQEEISENGTNI